MNMNISELLKDAPMANTIEWYMIPSDVSCDLWVDIHYDTPQFPSIHFRNPQHLHEYRFKELTYVYDRSNDSQRTLSRMLQKEILSQKSMYIIVLQEETLPTHRFPCSEQIEDNGMILRRSFKINNRLFFIEESYEHVNKKYYSYYIRYQHAPNVDIDKMQMDLNQFLSKFRF
jgi:hypothetical protein